MVSIEMLRRLLDVADVRLDPYAVADVSASLLEMDVQDGCALRHYLRALAGLELGVAARRVCPAGATRMGSDGALRQTLEKLPAGLVPWSSRKRRFQANLKALESRGIATAPLLAAWEDPSQKNAERYELHAASDGNFQILELASGDTAGGGDRAARLRDAGHSLPVWKAWLGGLQNFKGALAAISAESFKGQLRGPMAFDGIGHGWLIPHILEISERTYLNYSAAMYIVEPDLVAFCMALHLQDIQTWLMSPRLRLFLGEGASDRFLTALRENPGWSLPTSFVFNPLRVRPSQNLQPAVESLITQRGEHRRQSLERIEKYYAAIDGPAWRRRYAEASAGGPPLRVLGITTRYSTVLRYSMEELQASAAASNGAVQMEICMEPDDQSLEKEYVGMIDRLKPDLLISISRMRYEMPDLPRNIPALCWDQDNLQCMRDPGALADMRGLTFVAGHGAVFGSIHLNWPLPACIFCHPAGMTHRYRPGAPTAEESAQFGADISYVSHASGTPEQLRDSLRAKWTGGASDFLPLFDASCEEVIQSTRSGTAWEFLELQDLVRRLAGEKTLPLPEAVAPALMTDLRLLVDRVFRHQTLAWVAHWCELRKRKLRIWGNGWSAHPALARWAAGTALPGEQAQAVYRASTINLQIIETGLLHSRLLDGWAAGGFFLMRQAHRSQDEVRIAHCHEIGILADVENIQTLCQLESRGSPALQSLWRPLAPEYAFWNRDREFPGFRMWRSLVPAQVLLPTLDQIMFKDGAEFERLADTFIASAPARARVSVGIREVLDQHLSYGARWRDFVGHLAANLGYAGVPADGGAATK